jgi:hypothetical protein
VPATPWKWSHPVIKSRLTGNFSSRRQAWTGKWICIIEIEQTRRPMFAEDDKEDTNELIWRDVISEDYAEFNRWRITKGQQY